MVERQKPGTILALMAHPDDAEFLCGGTLALLAAKGWAVHIAAATPGDAGAASLQPDEIAAIRRREGASAAGLVGGTFHCLERRDLRVFYDEDGVRRAHSLLRKVRPDLVITHSPADYLLDHEEISKVARTACFGAAVPNAPALDANLPPCGKIPCLYYADPIEGIDLFGQPVRPSFAIDISSVLNLKLDMLARHASQREWLRLHHGMDEYLESARRWSQQRGALIGAAAAEGFRQHLGHAYPRENLLLAALGEKARML
ncbi:MAG: PIG-L family deacetylase [Planctomycetes bacterium]|nr:PIG-L family deacetylase [Planctomycetota bacterium]